ncbi:MAG: PAS/PAC sensor hybrid histidine kinase, partial [uncultured bacterium]
LVSAPLDKIDQVIENALGLSTRFFGAERGYVFQVDLEGETLTNTHEWCANSVEPLMPKYQQYPLEQLPAVLAFDRHAIEYLHFPDVNTMPEAMADFRQLLIKDRVKSILLLPMLAQGKFIGLFGYDCVESSRSWSFEEITLLKVISEIFSNALYKKNVEKQIRENEERYRFLVENINDIIWIFDVDTLKYIYISPSLKRIFGYTPEELMQNEIAVHLPPESLKKVLDYLPERLENLRSNRQTCYTEELEQICKDGRRILTELTQNWVFNPITGHAEMIGITRDITERKELEEQRRLLELQRQQSLKADSLGRMAGSIAHHFNNQLQVILGNLELLTLDKHKSGNANKSISDAMRATYKASEMSSLMLTYLGQHQTEGQISNLHELCSSQLKSLREHLPAAHQLILAESGTDQKVNINRDHFFQILRNVVTNASEACSTNSGIISIDISKVPTNEIPLKHRFPIEWVPEHEHYMCLRVHDNGRGIPDEDIYKTFDPFFSTKGPGRGLGLANTLGFMRSIGGGITLSSRHNHGCTFCLYFPIIGETHDRPLQTLKGSKIRSRVEMILVIEDEEMVRFITRSLLENFNYKVIEADSGAKALEILAALKGQIDLVICDLVMPDMDGWQTLEELRKIEQDVPVILASGYDQSFVMRGAHQQQPQAFLSKPYNSATLQQAIEQALS